MIAMLLGRAKVTGILPYMKFCGVVMGWLRALEAISVQ